MRYTACLLILLSACGTELAKSLPELAPLGRPANAAAQDSDTGDKPSTEPPAPTPTPSTPLPTTGLVDDFRDGNGVAEGWGSWKTYGGGASSPTNEQHSILFTAPGYTDNSGQLTYTADSGGYSYSQVAITFNPNQNLHDNVALRFRMKGTGPGVVGLFVMTRLSNSSNNYATYGITLGPAQGDWTLYDLMFNKLSNSGSPPFSLADALAPNNFQGFKWSVGKPSGSTTLDDRQLQLDDVALHP